MKYLLTVFVVTLFGCASSDISDNHKLRANTPTGFLSNYDLLEPVELDDQSTTMRYVSSSLEKGIYSSVLLEPVVFFPRPEESHTLSTNTLSEVRSYASSVIESTVLQSMPLATKPGPDTLRLKVAITGISTENDELEAYQYIPIAFLLTAASGRLNDVVVKIQIEGELSDSMTGEPLILATKSGLGETLTNESTPLALDNVMPLLDSWGKTLRETLSKIVLR